MFLSQTNEQRDDDTTLRINYRPTDPHLNMQFSSAAQYSHRHRLLLELCERACSERPVPSTKTCHSVERLSTVDHELCQQNHCGSQTLLSQLESKQFRGSFKSTLKRKVHFERHCGIICYQKIIRWKKEERSREDH